MKLNTTQKVILVVVGALLATSVAYAVFTTALNIMGEAGTSGNWDIKFTSATVENEYLCDDSTITLSTDKKTANISVTDLQAPGAYAEFELKIENNGNIDGKLQSIVVTPETADDNIKVTYNAPSIGSVLEVDDYEIVTVKVSWDLDSEETTEEYSFSIKLNYIQEV